MLIGSDIRTYRRRIGLTQIEFAPLIGLTQSALSLLESGRVAISTQHLNKLRKEFVGKKTSPTFAEFEAELSKAGRATQHMLAADLNQFATLTVYPWLDAIDLSEQLRHSPPVSVVSVSNRQNRLIAFKMPRETKYWATGEIIAFEECSVGDIKDADVCLVVTTGPKPGHTRTVVAAARVTSGRGPTKFAPIRTRETPIPADDKSILTIMRNCYRAREV